MLTKSTKILSILLFVIFIYNYFGYFFVFKVIQSGIKSKMENAAYEKVEYGDLVKFAFHKSEDLKDNNKFQWIHDKEFIYQNEFYDIVKTETRNDSIIYYCINDKEETELVNNFKKISNERSDGKRSNQHYVLKFFQKDYLTKKNYYPKRHKSLTSWYNQHLILYKSIIIDIPTPPPQFS